MQTGLVLLGMAERLQIGTGTRRGGWKTSHTERRRKAVFLSGVKRFEQMKQPFLFSGASRAEAEQRYATAGADVVLQRVPFGLNTAWPVEGPAVYFHGGDGAAAHGLENEKVHMGEVVQGVLPLARRIEKRGVAHKQAHTFLPFCLPG